MTYFDTECSAQKMGTIKTICLIQWKFKKDKKKYESMPEFSKSAVDFFEWALNNNRLMLTKVE